MDNPNEAELDPKLIQDLLITPLKEANLTLKQPPLFIEDYSLLKPIAAEIDPTSTMQYHIDQQTKKITEQGTEQLKSLSQQSEYFQTLIKQQEIVVSTLKSQNETLTETNEQLRNEISDNKVELIKSKRYNITMLIITLLACIAAIVSAFYAVRSNQIPRTVNQAIIEADNSKAYSAGDASDNEPIALQENQTEAVS